MHRTTGHSPAVVGYGKGASGCHGSGPPPLTTAEPSENLRGMLSLHPLRVSRKPLVVFCITISIIVGGGIAHSKPSSGPSYEELVLEARSGCKRAKPQRDTTKLRALVDIERSLKIPHHARGILLAAACMESGYRVKPRCGDKGKSCGMFQVRTWLSKRYKVDRYDYKGVARALLTQVLRSLGKARRKCGKRRPSKLFWIAYSWITRGPQGWNCWGASKHKRLLRRWMRGIRKRKRLDKPRGCRRCLPHEAARHRLASVDPRTRN
jgi:hypothetical protein